jgi:hypothetical protein
LRRPSIESQGLTSDSTKDPLESSWLKIERANQHANALDATIQRWLEDRPYSLSLDVDGETGEQVCRIHVTRTPPLEWSVVIGEAIHGLRTALDHAVFALSSLDGEPPGGTEFPIFKDEPMFRNANRPGGLWKIRGLSDAAKGVVESVQPFHHSGGEPEIHLLWVLHQLSNADKHRSLNLTSAFLGQGELSLEADGGVTLKGTEIPVGGPVEDGGELARWSVAVSGEGKVELNGKIAYGVAFDEAGPAKGEPIKSSFDMLGNGVKSIVRMLSETL